MTFTPPKPPWPSIGRKAPVEPFKKRGYALDEKFTEWAQKNNVHLKQIPLMEKRK